VVLILYIEYFRPVVSIPISVSVRLQCFCVCVWGGGRFTSIVYSAIASQHLEELENSITACCRNDCIGEFF
jgi:hypothetical protein